MVTVLMAPPAKPVARTPDGEPGRRILWVGQQSPLDNPLVTYRIATGQYTKRQEELLRKGALRTVVRTETNSRRMSPADPKGLSREYVWGPGKARWVQVLTYADADILFSCSSADEFRDLDATEADEPLVIAPPANVRIYGESVFKAGQSVDVGRALLRNQGRG